MDKEVIYRLKAFMNKKNTEDLKGRKTKRYYLPIILGIGILFSSLVIRISFYPIITDDYIFFLSGWFEHLAENPGLSGFEVNFSNYAPVYLYFLKLLTLIPVPALYSIKTLSFLFDIIIAVFAVLMVKKTSGRKYSRSSLFLLFTVVLSIPTLVLNSSMWGQADSVYAAGAIGSLYFILANRPVLAAISFGFAFSVKAQSVFLLPVIAGFLLRKRETARYVLIIPLFYLLSIIPAWLGGGSLQDLIFVYLNQAGEYSALSMNAPSIFGLINEEVLSETVQSILFFAGLGIGAVIAMFITLLVSKAKYISNRAIVFIGLFSTLTLPYFLPGMHERFFFLADILSIIYAWYNPSHWYIPVLVITASFFSYMPYLSNAVPALEPLNIGLRIPSILILITLTAMVTVFVRRKI